MFEVPDSDIVAVHIDEKAVKSNGSVHYSRSSSESDEVPTVSDLSSHQQLSQDRESMSRTEGSMAA